jgi:hypothetical protein
MASLKVHADEKHLRRYALDQLSTLEASWVESHLANCSACRQALTDLRQTTTQELQPEPAGLHIVYASYDRWYLDALRPYFNFKACAMTDSRSPRDQVS